jgi:hypothetical protein
MATYVSMAICVGSVAAGYGLWVAERAPRWRALLTFVGIASLATSIVLRKLYPTTG